MSGDFVLHERLAADTVALDDWPLSRVLLMNDQSYPWLILVPRRPGLKEIHDLGQDDRAQLTEEICRASRALQSRFSPDKVNVGALGNLVPQLHVHVIARFTTDSVWPAPVWGKQPPVPYESGALQERIAAMTAAFAAGA
jgi:diadenosine tetraphosphate (Ap4A) HIT family hydrolase